MLFINLRNISLFFFSCRLWLHTSRLQMMRFIKWVGSFSNAYGKEKRKTVQWQQQCTLSPKKKKKTTWRDCSCGKMYISLPACGHYVCPPLTVRRARTCVVQVRPAFNSQLSTLMARVASLALVPAKPGGLFLLPESHCNGFVPRHSCCSATSDWWSWMNGCEEWDSRRVVCRKMQAKNSSDVIRWDTLP